jgi:serine/threonine-protein kinase
VLLGKYQVERVLGQGGMGVVVAARHLGLGELFALKFLLPEAMSSDSAVERFLREARSAARLKGEHVAKVHDVGRLETGAPYMVMEHLEGQDLRAVLQARGPLSMEEAAALVIQACEAISEAHAVGIIHRDLKPSNLFLTRRPSGAPCVKVLDFGISKQGAADEVDLTKSGALLGSPLYMSPEQMTHAKNADPRSDVWSMGVVLYELIAGRSPFASGSITGVIASVLQQDPPPPSQVRPELSAGLDAIVARCLEKRPERRFQSIDELAGALRLAIGVRHEAPVRPARALAQASRKTTSPTLDAVTAPPSGVVAASGWDRTGEHTPASRGIGKASVAAGAALMVAALGAGVVWFMRGPSAETVSPPPPGAAVAAAATEAAAATATEAAAATATGAATAAAAAAAAEPAAAATEPAAAAPEPETPATAETAAAASAKPKPGRAAGTSKPAAKPAQPAARSTSAPAAPKKNVPDPFSQWK